MGLKDLNLLNNSYKNKPGGSNLPADLVQRVEKAEQQAVRADRLVISVGQDVSNIKQTYRTKNDGTALINTNFLELSMTNKHTRLSTKNLIFYDDNNQILGILFADDSKVELRYKNAGFTIRESNNKPVLRYLADPEIAHNYDIVNKGYVDKAVSKIPQYRQKIVKGSELSNEGTNLYRWFGSGVNFNNLINVIIHFPESEYDPSYKFNWYVEDGTDIMIQFGRKMDLDKLEIKIIYQAS